MTEKEEFLASCARVVGNAYERDTVGLLKEKTLHAVMKDFIEPNHAYHEKKTEGFVADVLRPSGEIFEIQTRSFDRLRRKLAAFLPKHPVTVVYPIPAAKMLSWLDAESGEASSFRKVPKKGSFYDAGRELARILPFLHHPNLSILLLLIDMEEYRLKNGWGKDGKRGSERYDRIPTALSDSLLLTDAASYEALFPFSLASPFTAKEFRRAVKGGPRTAPELLRVLGEMGVVERCGKQGNAFLYRKAEKK